MDWRADSDTERSDLELLVENWWLRYEDMVLKLSELMILAENLGLFTATLSRSNERAKQTAFGYMMLKHKDQPVLNYRIKRVSKGSSANYQLEPLPPPAVS